MLEFFALVFRASDLKARDDICVHRFYTSQCTLYIGFMYSKSVNNNQKPDSYV